MPSGFNNRSRFDYSLPSPKEMTTGGFHFVLRLCNDSIFRFLESCRLFQQYRRRYDEANAHQDMTRSRNGNSVVV
jgi:hypothetical protein